MPYWVQPTLRECAAVEKGKSCKSLALSGSRPPRCARHIGKRNRARVDARKTALLALVAVEAAMLRRDADRLRRRQWKENYYRKVGVCRCAAYGFPHRTGSGRCNSLAPLLARS